MLINNYEARGCMLGGVPRFRYCMGMGWIQLGNGQGTSLTYLLGMADQDGDDSILWERIGDGGGLHTCPHSPKFFLKKRKKTFKLGLPLFHSQTTSRLQTFCVLVEGTDRKFGRLRDVPAYGGSTSQHQQQPHAFQKVFKAYTRVWKHQQENRTKLVSAG